MPILEAVAEACDSAVEFAVGVARVKISPTFRLLAALVVRPTIDAMMEQSVALGCRPEVTLPDFAGDEQSADNERHLLEVGVVRLVDVLDLLRGESAGVPSVTQDLFCTSLAGLADHDVPDFLL